MGRMKKDVSGDAEAAGAPEQVDNGAAVEKPRTQREAVKLALRAKKGASNEVLQDYIQSAFGMFLKKTVIATLKSQLKAEARRGPTPDKAAPKARAEGYTLQDLRMVQDLVARVGGQRVRDMIELFDK